MRAIDITGQPPGGNRIPIAQLVPLDTPLVIQIFPIYSCNFTCKYCTLSIPKDNRGFISDEILMRTTLFEDCIDDCSLFPQQVKVLRFVGMGEPLLHKQLSEMIRYAADSHKFERIEILTNASLLTNKLAHQLSDSGLTTLLISIQGTSAEKYWEISKVKIDFQHFIDNIRYFYELDKVKVHIKIADCALDGEEDKARFLELFGNICDTIAVETIGAIHEGVEYNTELNNKTINTNQYGVECTSLNICSQPFHFMQINPDGKVVPCYSIEYPDIMGDARIESLYDIWNGEKYRQFRLQMLYGIDKANPTCCHCNIFKHRAYKGDDLSTEVDRLREIYQ